MAEIRKTQNEIIEQTNRSMKMQAEYETYKKLKIRNEAIETIDELLILIENSGESFRMSNDYLYNVLSRIRKELK